MRLVRLLLSFGFVAYALPITCSQSGVGVNQFTGGVTPSPAHNINPQDPLITNGGTR